MPGWLLQIITRLAAAGVAGVVGWLVDRGLLDPGAAADAESQLTTGAVVILSSVVLAIYGAVRPLISRVLHPEDHAR